MSVNPILKIIRAKKLGLLIRDARLKNGKSLRDCAQAMGVSTDELGEMEYGDRAPTLPEVELLALFLDIPLEHFWKNELLVVEQKSPGFEPEEIKQTRQAIIGNLIQTTRQAAGMTEDELAEKAGVSADVLRGYESGAQSVPLPDLELLAHALNQPLSEYGQGQASTGGDGREKVPQSFLDLPVELQDFVSKPVNQPYLEIALRLSELQVERLRALAEGLLEITL